MTTPGRGRPPLLPPALTAVPAPPTFSPSTFAALVRCPLSQVHGLEGTELLAPDAAAILGTILHETIARLSRNFPTGVTEDAAALAEFDRVVAETEAAVRREWPGAGLVPLRTAVGRTVWRRGRTRLLKWAGEAEAAGTRVGDRRASFPADVRHPSALVPTREIPYGREQSVRVPSLRLSGRPDLVERGTDVVHVTDLKSGAVTDEDGDIRSAHVDQLRLYALMLEEIEPGVRVRLWLHGAERVEVPWTDRDRAELRERLGHLVDLLPRGRSVRAEALAKPGHHCRACRIRHRCPGYRKEAPVWWRATSPLYPVAPFDIWGTPVAPNGPTPGTGRFTLRDAAGRSVLVAGVPEALAGSLERGESIWFFGLRPAETLPLHGAYNHPRNFRLAEGETRGATGTSAVFRGPPVSEEHV